MDEGLTISEFAHLLMVYGFAKQEDGTYVREWLEGGARITDRWNGKSARIDRSVQLPGKVDKVTINCTFAGKTPGEGGG